MGTCVCSGNSTKVCAGYFLGGIFRRDLLRYGLKEVFRNRLSSVALYEYLRRIHIRAAKVLRVLFDFFVLVS